jgi:hypothetical protein
LTLRELWNLKKNNYNYSYLSCLCNKNIIYTNFFFFLNFKLFYFKNYYFNFILKIIKFKLKGKTLKYRRITKSNILFKVGLTHVVNCWLLFTIFFKKKGKQKFFFFSYNLKLLLLNAKNFIKWKKPNLYHWRGIRINRMLMYRKAGKVSEYFK